MAIPPFQNTRLNKHEEPSKEKLEELFDALTRNNEDLYDRFATSEQVTEATSKRTIGGRVTEAGGVEGGVGFTVVHPSAGRYIITLATSLPTYGVCVASPAGPLRTASTTGVSKTQFEVLIYNTTTAAVENQAFSFIVRQL